MNAFIAKRKAIPPKIKRFGNIYALLDYLGTERNSGKYENDFAEFRAGLINKIPHGYPLGILKNALESKELEISAALEKVSKSKEMEIEIEIDDYNDLTDAIIKDALTWETSDENLNSAISEFVSGKTKKHQILYDILKNALTNGMLDQEFRFDILDFVSGKTKKYWLLYAVLEGVDFTREKEFSIIYGNFARQPIDSRDKRQNLSDLRDAAVETLISQTDQTLNQLSQKKTRGLSEKPKPEEEQKISELSDIFQNNLLFITNYEMSDYIFGEILKRLDFHRENFFKIFYKNLIPLKISDMEDQRWEDRRQLVIEYVKTDKDKDFIKKALSVAFTHERLDKIMEDILAFIDAKEKAEENPEKIILNVPLSSLNYEKYEEYKEKKDKDTEKKSVLFSIKIDEDDKSACKKMIKRIQLEGTKTVVSGFYDKDDKKKLTRFAEIIFQAILTGLITAESDIEEIQREVAKYDWQLSRNIDPKNIRATCSAEIIVIEAESDLQQILDFNELVKKIAELKLGKQ